MSAVPELRRAALARASEMRDQRVAEVLRRAVVRASERAGEAWESSDGTVRALDVRLELDGYALGLCDAFPSLRDAVIETLTGEAPDVLGASVTEFEIEWALRERPGAGLYRDEVPQRADRARAGDVRRALIGFLLGSGDERAARALDDAELVLGEREVEVLGARTIDVATLEHALSALLGRPMRARLS